MAPKQQVMGFALSMRNEERGHNQSFIMNALCLLFLPQIISISFQFQPKSLHACISHNLVCASKRSTTTSTLLQSHHQPFIDEKFSISNVTKQRRTLFVCGNGNVAQSLVQYIDAEKKEEFEAIYVTTRHLRRENSYNFDLGNETFVTYIPFESEQSQQILSQCTHALITIPPIISRSNPGSTEKIERVPSYVDPILDHPKYNQAIQNVSWVGYVSTTGVYGDHDGDWVNEKSECRPNGLKAQCYCDVEKRWKRLLENVALGNELRIFRCAGIYGEQFSALHTVLKKGFSEVNIEAAKKTVLKDNAPRFTSRIHLEDIARAITSSMLLREVKRNIPLAESSNLEVYNLADDDPAQRQIVMNFARSLLADAGMLTNGTNKANAAALSTSGERMKRRSIDRKRVCNNKLKKVLLLSCGGLKFPTYREGLVSILHCWKAMPAKRIPGMDSEE